VTASDGIRVIANSASARWTPSAMCCTASRGIYWNIGRRTSRLRRSRN